ncbi:MAG: CvpA family protein [Deltaproteobacteria bacterium]|nr:CvpA family protein [Deltaproteobacteria bacterium]
MWLDIVALLLLGLFAGMGAMRGALASGLAVLTLAAAYGAAIWAAPTFGPEVAGLLGVPEWLGMPIAGTAAFLLTFVVMGIVSTMLRRLERRKRLSSRSPRDRFVGGAFGAVRGALVVLLLSYLALWVDALRITGTVEAIPELGPSAAASLTENVVEAGVQAAMSDSGTAGRVVSRMAARPGAAMRDFQEVMEHPAIDELRSDPLFWSYVEHGNVDAALNRSSFLRLSHDGSVRRRLGDLGLIEADAVDDPRLFRAAAAEVFREVGPRIRDLHEDPALRELLEDPEVAAMLQSGNHFALLSHPGFREVVARTLENTD